MDKIRAYFTYATERSLKTFAQTALATMGVASTGLFSVDWVNVASISALAMVMSLLTSVLQYDRPKVDA
tara:strand:+ start:580 stop:786 length:207 start_codon:yes stop_codon:yes gene_type:complete